MCETDPLDLHAERIRASELFGRSAQLHKLFDYLVECTRSGRISKEAVIAVEVFGRRPDFDVSSDAAVRVAVYKLRRKLDEFYADNPTLGSTRLTLPKGEYRLVFEDIPPPAVAQPAPRTRNPWKIATFVSAAALLLVAIAATVFWQRTPARQFAHIRQSPVWSQLLSGIRPITVVFGLQREYLPTSSAHVMADIMPVLAATHRPINVIMMSDLVPDDLKSTDVIYVGYLSGLGMLYDGAFSGSRFSIGSTFDELTDNRTKARYVSQAGTRYLRQSDRSTALAGSPIYRDYSLVTGFRGPRGNWMLVIAGTRDVGLIQAGEAVTDPNRLRELREQVAPGTPFEALYEVSGMNGTEMSSKLLVTSTRPAHNTWGHVAAPPDGAEPQHSDTVALAGPP